MIGKVTMCYLYKSQNLRNFQATPSVNITSQQYADKMSCNLHYNKDLKCVHLFSLKRAFREDHNRTYDTVICC